MSRGATLADASRSRFPDNSAGLRADHREKRNGFSAASRSRATWGWCHREESSGDRRRFPGHITKQGSSLLRFLLVEAAQVTVRSDPEWRSRNIFTLAMRRGRKIAKGGDGPPATAVRLYWMWRKGWDYQQLTKFSSHAGEQTSRWCAAKHRVIDWVSRSPSRGSSK